MDKLYCPGCRRAIQGKKNKLVYCQCGKALMIIEINKIKQIVDVTKEDK